ncbi:MAG: NYN domain-containing protein [Polyangiales bacterium]
MAAESLIAVFIDFENLAIGAQVTNSKKFRVELVLKRLLEKGRIVYKRAYCDWSRYRPAVKEFHGHGIGLVDIPQTKMSGKNSADIHMVVDALDLCHSKEHIDTFALLSGDSDFSPLVAKLKENDKRVIGVGVKKSTSELLIAGCDEFVYYDDLVRAAKPSRTRSAGGSAKLTKKDEALDRFMETVRSMNHDYETIWGSMVKQTLRRVYPGFSESYYGYRSFSDLMKDAESRGLVELSFDPSGGNYRVTPT